jgi:hypothetical protein
MSAGYGTKAINLLLTPPPPPPPARPYLPTDMFRMFNDDIYITVILCYLLHGQPSDYSTCMR